MPASHPPSALRRGLAAAALALLLPAGLLAGPTAPAAAATPGGCGQLFDDFSYTSSADPQLAARGWSVRSGGGGPGVGGSWSPSNVTFTGSGAARAMRLAAQTDGTPAGTVSAELSSQQRKFFQGTYASRVRFTNAPVSGADGDPVVQTFYTITPLAYSMDPSYGEADFEYLPNGGWGQTSPTMFLTTWETYQPDPWVSVNQSTPAVRDLAGWHDLVMQVDGGVVRYFIDGREIVAHSGDVYPETPMHLSFNIWFIDLLSHSGGVSRYEQDVDYVFHSADEVLSPAQVGERVAGLRAAGTTHADTVVPGTCTPTTTPTGGAGAVRSGAAGMCLDVAGAKSANGTAVQLYECNGTVAQRWTFGGDGTLRAMGKCLDVADWGTANGSKVQIWDCNPGQSNQTWVRHGSSYRNPASGRCLDNPDGRALNSQRLQLWDCYGNSAQWWSLPGV